MQDTIAKIPSSMPTFLKKTSLILISAILSLVAQGLIFAPNWFAFLLTLLPNWGNLTYGGVLLIVSFLLLGYALRKFQYGQQIHWILFAIQAATVGGLFLLHGSLAPSNREAVFLVTSLITLLATYGILFSGSKSQKSEAMAP